MKITFLGSGGAFCPLEQGQSNMLIEVGGKTILIDCGTDCRHLLADHFGNEFYANPPSQYVDAIYISHVHADHIGGLEWFAFMNYFGNGKRIPLIISESILDDLWQRSLAGGLRQLTGKQVDLTEYFDLITINESGEFNFKGVKANFCMIPCVHVPSTDPDEVKWSYGLMVKEGDCSFLISTDCSFDENWQSALSSIAHSFDIIFHDCDTGPNPNPVHPHYSALKQLPASIKRKMWLYHYRPTNLNAVEDGFAGFVKKGMQFTF